MLSNDEIKMTNDEIKKALECCSIENINTCEYCPFEKHSNCKEEMLRYTLDLINQYEAEIETLRKEKNKLMDAQMFLAKTSDEQQAEIERLEDAKNAYKDIVDTCEIGVIKEFAEKIFKEIQDAILSNDKAKNERIEKHNVDRYEDDFCIMCDGKISALGGIRYFIYNLLKEMGVE